jgi:hypothetical protein
MMKILLIALGLSLGFVAVGVGISEANAGIIRELP